MSKHKLLVIDDNSMIRDLFQVEFEEDFILEMAVDGASGIEAAATMRPDVILLDINMPDMSGIEVAGALFSRADTRNIPIIVITSSEYNTQTESELRQYGNFKGFLSKVSPAEKIRENIQRVLR